MHPSRERSQRSRSRSRSPRRTTDHYSPRRSPRPRNHDPNPLEYDDKEQDAAPPLPDEAPPPLPEEAPPSGAVGAPGTATEAQAQHSPDPAAQPADDGWDARFDYNTNAYYFYNRFTGVSQWENPRVPEASSADPQQQDQNLTIKPAAKGGYNPAIHGDYDPNADYAKEEEEAVDPSSLPIPQHVPAVPGDEGYEATAQFNRFTGRFQTADKDPSRHTDDAKAHRQMNAFFDVDAAANAHDGRSLKAERRNQKLSRKELAEVKQRKKEKKLRNQRGWLMD